MSASSNEYSPGVSVTPGSATGALNFMYSVRFQLPAFRLAVRITPSVRPTTAPQRVEFTIVLPSFNCWVPRDRRGTHVRIDGRPISFPTAELAENGRNSHAMSVSRLQSP